MLPMRKKTTQSITNEQIFDELSELKKIVNESGTRLHKMDHRIDTISLDLWNNFFKLNFKVDHLAHALRKENKQTRNEILQGIDRLTYRFKTLDEEHLAYVDWRDKTDYTIKIHDKDISNLKAATGVA